MCHNLDKQRRRIGDKPQKSKVVDTSCGYTRTNLRTHADKAVDTRGQRCGHLRTKWRTNSWTHGQSCGHAQTKLRTNLRTHTDKAVDTRGQSCGHLRTKLWTHADKLVDACGQSCGRTRTKWRTLWFRTVRFGFQTLGIFSVSLNFGSTV